MSIWIWIITFLYWIISNCLIFWPIYFSLSSCLFQQKSIYITKDFMSARSQDTIRRTLSKIEMLFAYKKRKTFCTVWIWYYFKKLCWMPIQLIHHPFLSWSSLHQLIIPIKYKLLEGRGLLQFNFWFFHFCFYSFVDPLPSIVSGK